MDVVDNNDFLDVFHVFGCLETIFTFYMDVVETIMTSLMFFMYLVVGKQYLHFTWMLWIIMTSLCFHVFGC